MTSDDDTRYMQRAIALAEEAEAEGNVPVGAVLVLDGRVIAEGKSCLIEPYFHPGRHAECEALRNVDPALWPRAAEMTCYSTLEPCVMCAGTLLLHGVGRVVFGAFDTLGGARTILDHLPAYYDEGGVYEWVGPTMPEVCDDLYRRADEIFAALPVGRDAWNRKTIDDSFDACLARLQAFSDRREPGRAELNDAREDLERARRAAGDEPHELGLLIPFAAQLFEQTSFLRDYRALASLSRAAGDDQALRELEPRVRDLFPDLWIKAAIDRGDFGPAVECWYAQLQHPRLRLAADAIASISGDDVELLISARMTTLHEWIRRKKRRHYQRACALLRQVRDELRDARAESYFPLIVDDLRQTHARLPAFLDELDRANL